MPGASSPRTSTNLIISQYGEGSLAPTARGSRVPAVARELYPTSEGLGLIKMDFLGLRNLTIISDALENIKMNRGVDLDLENLELDDAASYELLARGDTLGVFQLDGGPMRSLLKLMKPDNFEDISAVLALYRPGSHGRQRPHRLRACARTGSKKSFPSTRSWKNRSRKSSAAPSA